MNNLFRYLFILLVIFSCSKKVKYVKKEIDINVVPIPKQVNILDSNKHISFPKKIKIYIKTVEKNPLFEIISKDFHKLGYSNSFELIKNKNRSDISFEIEKI